jgi:hypothetical protein
MDLDQAVALFAGMTVLGLSLYRAADARYKRWWVEEKERREETARQRIYQRELREGFRRLQITIESGQRLNEEDIELQTGEELHRQLSREVDLHVRRIAQDCTIDIILTMLGFNNQFSIRVKSSSIG